MANLIRNKEIKNIAQVRKVIGEQATKAAVAVIVDELQKSVQLTQPMTPFQIDVAAEIICREYYYLKLEELRLCFINAISGKYGKIYNRIDAAIICEWMNQYISKRATVSERLNQIEQQQNNIYDTLSSPVVIDAIRQAANKLSIKETKPEPEPDRPKPSPFEQQVMDEWDAMPTEGWAHVRYYKQIPVDFTEYRKLRYTELIEQHNTEDHE